MDNKEAKRILLGYRPGSTEDQDPETLAALSQAERDAELRDWLREQTVFNDAVRKQLRSLPVPAGLRESILAERRVVVAFWRRPEFLLAAACLVLSLVLTGLWFSRTPEDLTFAGFRSRMVGFALRVYRMDITTNDLVQVREFLRKTGAPSDIKLTAGLQAVPVKGGARLSWQGHPVSMVCFQLPREDILYMFIMDEKAIRRGDVPGEAPVLREVGGILTASWRRDGKVYLVAAADQEAVKKVLAFARIGPGLACGGVEGRGFLRGI